MLQDVGRFDGLLCRWHVMERHKWIQEIINPLSKIFVIESQFSKVFVYLGIEINQNKDNSVMISQESYTYSINTIALSKDQLSNKEFSITLGTVPSVRFLLGQLNWLAQIPRPDISFDICNLSTEVKHMKVCNVINLNKAIKHIKRDI